MKDLISVIVPVYNVERYLIRCIDSIISQTYRELEIILVDDGSTDNCPQICDKFARRDSRVRVIHKKNGGLSDARNIGLDKAKGRYITFIDSDDFISEDMIEFLYKQICASKSDIATCSHRFFFEDNTLGRLHPQVSQETLNASEALREALYQRGLSMHAWSKLYRKDLFDTIRFPKGKLYEDIGTTYKLFAHAARISVNSDQKYFYLRREGSITGSAFNKRMLDSLDFAEEVHKYVKVYHPEAIRASECYLFSTAVGMTDLILQQPIGHSEELERCKQAIKRYTRSAARDPNVRIKDRLYSYAAFLNVLNMSLRFKNSVKEMIRK